YFAKANSACADAQIAHRGQDRFAQRVCFQKRKSASILRAPHAGCERQNWLGISAARGEAEKVRVAKPNEGVASSAALRSECFRLSSLAPPTNTAACVLHFSHASSASHTN